MVLVHCLMCPYYRTTISAKAYKLFKSYLSDRALFVASNGEISEHVGIKSGVPQGAIWSVAVFTLSGDFVEEEAALGNTAHRALPVRWWPALGMP